MDILKNKTIFLISPQPWGRMHVSKHHYAIQLVKSGNLVYFINPPDYKIDKTQIDDIKEYPGLKTVSFKPFFPWAVRFHARWLFDLLMKQQIKQLLKSIKTVPEIVWCFDPNTYSNLNWFKGKFNIYHPVDPITLDYQINVSNSADVVFSVSQKILSAFNQMPTPRFFINHGLGKDFEEQAKKTQSKSIIPRSKSNGKLKVGYVGNLLRKPIDRPLFLEIIENNPDLQFHLWGPYELQQSNVAGNNDTETLIFIEKLNSFPHVVLEGVRSPNQLALEIQSMDLFFLTYQQIPNESDRSNAHKLIEYLSTGKPILTIDIETYRDLGLMEMTPQKHDTEILTLFEKIKVNYEDYFYPQLYKKRLDYALDHTMQNQLTKIDIIITDIIANR